MTDGWQAVTAYRLIARPYTRGRRGNPEWRATGTVSAQAAMRAGLVTLNKWGRVRMPRVRVAGWETWAVPVQTAERVEQHDTAHARLGAALTRQG